MSNRAQFVLIIDENPVPWEGMVRQLETHGYLVLQARTCRAAREQFGIKPALLILDSNVPDTTRRDVARWLEALGATVPIVLVSTGASAPPRMPRLRLVAFLAKPFTIEVLLAVVQEHLLAAPGLFGLGS